MTIHNLGDRIMNTYIYPVGNDYIMIDTGYENSFKSVLKKAERLSVDFTEVKYIFLTHAHDDHAGFLKEMLEIYPQIKVVAHEKALPVLRRGQNSFEGGCAGLGAFLFCKIMALFGKGKHLFPAVGDEYSERFIIISDDNISEIEGELQGEILFTPGHTADSISLKVGNIIFCGDATMNGIPSRNKITIWIEDKTDFESSWETLISQKTEMLYPAHGKPFSPSELEKNKSEIAIRRLFSLK